ncbi:MAG: nickel pincer cofactor biosynthesis protein LarB [Myxococcales bacterium]|nr:nickel pincer cofactor biosynthesis protein LarB [Myxococcales bacterium]
MSLERLRDLLERVRGGELDVGAAVSELRALPFGELADATVDHQRAHRLGVPEVIFGEGKTQDQIALIAGELHGAGQRVLVTRIDPEKAAFLAARFPGLKYARVARTARLEVGELALREVRPVAVVCAGTSDLPVAEEALETLAAVGLPSVRIVDVGVAGLHRLLAKLEVLETASVIIAIAGMEGALPSVLGGLVRAPVIAVPTSVGYGTALGGFTPLMAMLTSCASGVTVVNIDNGFGAAMAAHRILAKRIEA